MKISYAPAAVRNAFATNPHQRALFHAAYRCQHAKCLCNERNGRSRHDWESKNNAMHFSRSSKADGSSLHLLVWSLHLSATERLTEKTCNTRYPEHIKGNSAYVKSDMLYFWEKRRRFGRFAICVSGRHSQANRDKRSATKKSVIMVEHQQIVLVFCSSCFSILTQHQH